MTRTKPSPTIQSVTSFSTTLIWATHLLHEQQGGRGGLEGLIEAIQTVAKDIISWTGSDEEKKLVASMCEGGTDSPLSPSRLKSLLSSSITMLDNDGDDDEGNRAGSTSTDRSGSGSGGGIGRHIGSRLEDMLMQNLEQMIQDLLPAPPKHPDDEEEDEEEGGRGVAGTGKVAPYVSPPSQILPGGGWGGRGGDALGRPPPPPPHPPRASTNPRALETLSNLGVTVYTRDGRLGPGGTVVPVPPVDFDDLAGGEGIKASLEDLILLPLEHPKEYDDLVKKTRAKPEPNQYGSFLFSGPPGVGKTLAARILATKIDRPLVILSFDALGSKYYAETEKRLVKVLDAVNNLDGAVIFVDEADALFPSRTAAHDTLGGAGVSHKLLSSMLRFMEGMEGKTKTTIIFATNRPHALDPALLSRCGGTLLFSLPSHPQRVEIWKRYAKHLGSEDLTHLANETEGMSGRDIRHIAEMTERVWLGDRWRKAKREGASTSTPRDDLPPRDLYLRVAKETVEGEGPAEVGAEDGDPTGTPWSGGRKAGSTRV